MKKVIEKGDFNKDDQLIKINRLQKLMNILH